MKRIVMVVALLMATLLALAPAGKVQAQQEKSQPYVILVGINKYMDKQILPREHAEQDAKALYDLFAHKGRLGVDAKHIKLLLGSKDEKRHSEAATRENILNALKWVSENAKKNDLVIFGFFGQGAPLGDKGCYFATDSTFKNRAKDAVASGDIEPYFTKLKSKRGVVLLDVDFTGFNPGKERRPDPNLSGFYREFLGNVEDSSSFSRVVFLANSGLRPSLNLGKHGLFAKVILDGLSGKADKAGYEPDGLITIEELAKYVRTELPALVRKYGKNDEDKQKQMPIVLEGNSHNFVVDLNPEVWQKAHRLVESFKKIADKENLPKKVTEEGEFLLHRMPKLEAKQDLRKIYQKLANGKLTVAAFTRERQKILDSMKLTSRELRTFAAKVREASQKVLDEYFKEENRGQLIAWAIEGMYKQVNEKIPSDIEKKLENVKKLSEIDLVRLLINARKYLGRREDLGNGKDLTYALHYMLTKLDRHTDYYDPDQMRALLQQTQGQFSGIGVQIRRNSTKDALEVVTPLLDSPAYKKGIYTGDLIRTIVREVDKEGNPLPKPEVLSTKGMSTSEAVKKILGKAGTKVKLIVEREGAKKPLEFELIRGNVQIETVLGHKRNKDDSWDYVIDPENKICYIRLTEFSRNTQRDLARAMKDLSKVGIKGFILDLRFNPGGLLDSAVKISDMFIDDGMIVTIRPRNGPETSYIGKADGSYLTFPMVCLVNGYSASGSEIVSACLQDHGRAIIIGTRSYGKGSVQTIHPFQTRQGLAELKLTTATFWRPNGRNLNKSSTKGRPEDVWGVKPNKGFNIEISRRDLNKLQEFMRFNEIIHRPGKTDKNADILNFKDVQLEQALQYLRRQIHTAAKAEEKKAGVARN